MRKVFTLLATILALASCNKETSVPTPVNTVTIGIKQVQSGSMTKASDAEVKSVLDNTTMSRTMALKLTSKENGNIYTVTVNEPIDLPIGTYTVFGEYTAPKIADAYSAILYSEPPFHVEQELVITEDDTNYLVDAIYDCIALVFDMTVTGKVEHKTAERTYTELSFTDDLSVAYARCTRINAEMTYHVRVSPKNDLYGSQTDFTIQWVENGEGLHVTNGFWYLLTPDSPTTISGTLGVHFPEWQKG